MRFWLAVGAAVGMFVLHGVLVLQGDDPATPIALARIGVYLFAEAAAMVSLAVAATRAHESRRALMWQAVAMGTWFAGDVVYEISNFGAEVVAYPAIPDLLYSLYFVPAFLALRALVHIGRRSGNALPIVDSACMLIAVFALVWFFIGGPVASDVNESVLARIASLSLVFGDLVVAGVVWWLTRFTYLGRTMGVRLLVSGLTGFVLCDTAYVWLSLHGDVVMGGWIDTVYVGSFTLVMLSAMRPSWQRMRRDATTSSPRRVRARLTFGMVVLAFIPVAAACAGVLAREDAITEVVLIVAAALGAAMITAHVSLIGAANEKVLSDEALTISDRTRSEVELGIHDSAMQELAVAKRALEQAELTGSLEQLDVAKAAIETASKRIRGQFIPR